MEKESFVKNKKLTRIESGNYYIEKVTWKSHIRPARSALPNQKVKGKTSKNLNLSSFP